MPEKPTFPTPELPEAERELRLLGLYTQRQKEFVLQRVRMLGGRVTPEQLLALADAAREIQARSALRLTTRQEIEFHSVVPERVAALQARIAAAGLTTLGSAGNTVRNSVVDPLGGVLAGTRDLLPLAHAVERGLETIAGVWTLPRKFKISYSADDRASMRPYFSDVGIVAAPDGTFRAIVAGSLGARPATGIEFGSGLTAKEVGALACAAVRLHNRDGDRQNRMRARLRHVRERFGDQEFMDKLRELHQRELVVSRTRLPQLDDPVTEARPFVRLVPPNADLPLDAVAGLAARASDADAEIRLGIEHDLYLIGVTREDLPEELAAWATGRRLVACPGTALCPKAAGPTAEAAEQLVDVADEHPELLFAISGCPNSCSHAAAAGVGIASRMKRDEDGERHAVYRVSIGGDAGAGPGLAHPVGDDATLEELAQTVRTAIARQKG